MGTSFKAFLMIAVALLLVACTPTDPYVDCQIPATVNSCRDSCRAICFNSTDCLLWENYQNYTWKNNGTHIETTPARNETQCNTWTLANGTNGSTCFNATIPAFSREVIDWIEVPDTCTCWIETNSTNQTLRLSVK